MYFQSFLAAFYILTTMREIKANYLQMCIPSAKIYMCPYNVHHFNAKYVKSMMEL